MIKLFNMYAVYRKVTVVSWEINGDKLIQDFPIVGSLA